MYFAHSKNILGAKHELKKHLIETAQRVKSFAPADTLQTLFYLAGLLHDSGKFQDGFQEYLEKGKPRTPHAGIGAFIAQTLFGRFIQLQFAIQGHHAGMPDNQDRISSNDYYSNEQETVEEVIRRFRTAISEFQRIELDSHSSGKDLLLEECATRLLFSALTDSDWLDTERHFSPEKSDAREPMVLDCDELLKALEKRFAQLATEGKINQLRTKARNEAASHFADPPGFFCLQLPTGLGKTLTSTYWALLHARKNGMKRIIIVLPYINIIDQTALVLKDVFGQDVVLEHHSGIVEDDEEYAKETFDKSPQSAKRLACENWDAPIIVTTSVQFFESLFSNKPFRCRKNHNISESVVIFDEIQTLPKHLAEPTIVMLKNIAALAKTSFLFCTATLPAFARREGFDGIDSIRPLIKNPKTYFDATKRVQYKLLNKLKPVAVDDVEGKLSRENNSYLVIVNTKSVAREFFQRMSSLGSHEKYYHLSTAMCPHHRKKTIMSIVADLKDRRRIAVVSTQLVEAGVDFDFPCVYRAIAPLDAVIQSAGRCNRNDELKGKGRVVLFKLEHQRMPDKTYGACADFTEVMIKDDRSLLHRTDSFENYYQAVTNLLVDVDKYNITEERRNFNFKTVNEQYQIIEKRTVPLLVADYSDESKALLDEVTKGLEFPGFINRGQYRRLQQFSVQVYPDFFRKYGSQIETIKDTLRIWHGTYSDSIGLAPEDVETVF